MAVAQCLDCRLDDEIRGAKIRLPDAEIDDVAALRGELHGARQHRERILLADTVEGGDSLQHGSPPGTILRGSSTQAPVKCKHHVGAASRKRKEEAPDLIRGF